MLSAVQPLLAEVGFRKRAAGIFTLDLTADVIGWVGLTTNYDSIVGALRVGPVIGVRHQRVAQLVAECEGEKSHPYSPPSLGRQLGYLMPEGRYLEWSHDDPRTRRNMTDLARQVAAYGVPHMRRLVPLDELCARYEANEGLPYQQVYWRPAAWYLAGDPERAEAIVRERLEGADARPSEAYQVFAANFLALLRSTPPSEGEA